MTKSKYFRILVGVPGTGKSTWLDQQGYSSDFGWDIHSTDNIVQEMSPDLTYNEAWSKNIKEAEKEFWARVEDSIARRRNIIIDRTNTTISARARFTSMVLNMRARKDYHISADIFGQNLNIHEWFRRLVSRPGKTIPHHVLQSMVVNFEMPSYDEAFDSMVIWS